MSEAHWHTAQGLLGRLDTSTAGARIKMFDKTCPFDPEAYAAAIAPLLNLEIDAAWAAAITANLRVLAAAAVLLTEFPLPDAVEAAPRFEA